MESRTTEVDEMNGGLDEGGINCRGKRTLAFDGVDDAVMSYGRLSRQALVLDGNLCYELVGSLYANDQHWSY